MTDSASESAQRSTSISREVLERDGIRTAMRTRHPDVPLVDNPTMRASIEATLAARPLAAEAVNGVWLFGYGSLLWNPCVAIAERRPARLYGFHRDFQLRLTYGRGSPEAPGLMLGLVPGGSCRGAALRIPTDNLRHELLLVWRREMLTGVYQPRWVWLRGEGRRLPAVTFVINPAHPCYCGRLADNDAVRLLATGEGLIGSSLDYLESAVAHLDGLGIHDRRLHALRKRAVAWRLARGNGCRR